MKKSFKHILSTLIILLLIAGPISASGGGIDKDSLELEKANQEAVGYIGELLNNKHIPTTHVDVWSDDNPQKQYSDSLINLDYFGGVYIDDGQNVNINVTHYDSVRSLKGELAKNQSNLDVYINIVKYTAYELELANVDLVEAGVLSLKGTEGIYTDIIDNSVVLLVYDDFNQVSLNALLTKLDLDRDMIKIEYTTIDQAPEFSAFIGKPLRKTAGGLNICSVGFHATRNGVGGFVTAAHCGAINQSYYTTYGKELGKVTHRQLSGKVDASWSPYSSIENVPKAFIHNGTYIPYSQANTTGLAIGQFVSNYTFNSPNTKTHTINSLNFSTTVGGILLSDIIRVNTPTHSIIGGDSGGGVSASNSAGNRRLIGIVSFTNGTHGGIIKVNNISAALGVTP